MKVFALMFLFAATTQAATYKLDPAHSQIGFSVKHLMVSNVKGDFKKFDGKFNYDSAKKEVKDIDVIIDTESIETGVADRDAHLKGGDFFDAKKYPKLIFKSQKAELTPDGKITKVKGMLTMRDKTLPVTLDVTNNGEVEFMGVKKVGFSASTKVNRKDWGLAWNKALDKGGVAVSDEVTINIEGEANLDDGKPAKK